MNQNSFISANALPSKLVIDESMIEDVKAHAIKPLHVQINPTNRCPLNCSFCSCSARDKEKEISWPVLCEMLYRFKRLGAQAVTITGGGDPLAYPAINEMLDFCDELGLKIGLVTNGLLFGRVNLASLAKVTWCRVSISQENSAVYDHLQRVVDVPIDWAFSYVLLGADDIEPLSRALRYANENSFTHVRVVDDILGKESRIAEVKKEMLADDSLAIYQGRKQYDRGSRRCLVSLLKPNISADGRVMPCCGAQYAQDPPALDYAETMSMGGIDELKTIYGRQKYFDGSVCSRCYYRSYNDILNILWDRRDIKHEEFK